MFKTRPWMLIIDSFIDKKAWDTLGLLFRAAHVGECHGAKPKPLAHLHSRCSVLFDRETSLCLKNIITWITAVPESKHTLSLDFSYSLRSIF